MCATSELQQEQAGHHRLVLNVCGQTHELFDFVAANDVVDMHVVICASYPGSFWHGINVLVELCRHLEKVADVLALQVQQGAASEDATSVLFETVVVGYVPSRKGAMLVVCLSDRGLTGGLQNV